MTRISCTGRLCVSFAQCELRLATWTPKGVTESVSSKGLSILVNGYTSGPREFLYTPLETLRNVLIWFVVDLVN